MSAVSLNGTAITGGTLTFPLRGTWRADLTVQGRDPDEVSGQVTLEWGDTKLTGIATAEADQGNKVTVRIVGGRGGLQRVIPPQHFVPPVDVGTVLRDALGLGGEKLSTTSDPTLVSTSLPQWTRIAGTVSDAIRRALAPHNATWRMLPDGTVWVGYETWDESDAEAVVVEESPTDSSLLVALEGATILPGVTWQDYRISGASYRVDDTRIRAELTYGETRGGTFDLLGEQIRREVAHLQFLGAYRYRVTSQNADETLELVSSLPQLPNMSKVPLRTPPGVTSLKVQSGTEVLVEFENGDPARPFAGLAYYHGIDKLTLDCPDIRLGGEAARLVAIAEMVKAQLDAIQTWAMSHTHGGVTVGVASTLVTTTPLTIGDVAATKTKAE